MMLARAVCAAVATLSIAHAAASGVVGGNCTSDADCIVGSSCVGGHCSCMACVFGERCPAGCKPPLACLVLGIESKGRSYCGVHNVALGGTCSANVACSSGNCVGGKCGLKKLANAPCFTSDQCSSGVCSPLLPLDGAPYPPRFCACVNCKYDPLKCPSGCADGLTCQRTVTDPELPTQLLCRPPPGPVGSRCKDATNCRSQLCESGVCAETRLAGASCTFDFQCASRSCRIVSVSPGGSPGVCECDATCNFGPNCRGGCTPPATCAHRDNAPNICKLQQPIGGHCGGDDSNCKSYHCAGGTCAAPRAVGSPCRINSDCPSKNCIYFGTVNGIKRFGCACDPSCGAFNALSCPGGCPAPQACVEGGKRCAVLHPIGGSCGVDSDCVGTAFCNSHGVCAAKLATNSACSSSRVCLSAQCVQGKCACAICDSGKCPAGLGCPAPQVCHVSASGGPPVCGLPFPAGHACQLSVDCASGVCEDFTRCAGVGARGAHCTANTGCRSGVCFEGACTCVEGSVGGPFGCGAPLTCVARYYGTRRVPTCVQLEPVGAVCASDGYCSSWFCRAGRCSRPLPNGHPCSADGHCLSGTCDLGLQICVCSTSCTLSATCPYGCAPGLPINAACSSDSVCTSGFCFHGACTAPFGGGAVCHAINEFGSAPGCISSTCIDGQCDAPFLG